MIKEVRNIMSTDSFHRMRETVTKMNLNIEIPIYEEMLHHKADYHTDTGLRKTGFAPHSSLLQYGCLPVSGSNGHTIGMEFLTKPEWLLSPGSSPAVFYIHGAGFQRRLQDLNLRLSERICEAVGSAVYAPDYRIGLDYPLEETLSDIMDSYRYLLDTCGYRAEHVTALADSSGACSLLAAIQHFGEKQLPCPGRLILFSPFSDASLSGRSIRSNQPKDLAFLTNHLLESSVRIFTRDGTLDVKNPALSTALGEYSCLKNTKVLIQVGTAERLLDDSLLLYRNLNSVCACTLELYEDMFHNFETYHSFCEMAKVSQEHYVRFLQA